MAATLGRIEHFQPEQESISSYLERMELFFTANDAADAKKAEVLLSCIGGTSYEVLKNILAPDSPGSKSYDDLASALKTHFEPKPSIIAQRFRFHQKKQEPNELVSQFSAELRHLARDCEFGAYLPDALRDQFVCGLRSESMHRRLLAEDTLTLKRALEIATGMEAASKDAKTFQNSRAVAVNLSVSRQNQREENHHIRATILWGMCKHCGRKNHSNDNCHFRYATCHSCGKNGPIATICKAPRKSKKDFSLDNHIIASTN